MYEAFEDGVFFQSFEVRMLNSFVPVGQARPQATKSVKKRVIAFLFFGNVGRSPSGSDRVSGRS